MERPSHIIFDKHQPWSRRLPFFAMAVSLQLAGLWLFTHGLATHLPPIFQPFHYVPDVEKTTPAPKPPEPDIAQKLKVIDVIPQDFKTEPSKSSAGSIEVLPPPGDGGIKPVQHILRAAVGILSTHTVPPYPPVALRMDAEGKVTLRLSVSAEGRVTRADIVTSSGREDLDQAAQTWILAHWTYKPAQDNGVAVASQVLAMVTFSLSNPR